MRALADATRVRELMQALEGATRTPCSVYLTGGATAVLHGWRGTTVDVDLRIEPELDEVLRRLVELKERLSINVELASPADFVPVSSDWPARSPFIVRHGAISFFHFDLHAQAFSKVERGHAQDLEDVRAMVERGLISAASMWRYYERVAGNLHRYPALDATALEQAMADVFGSRPAAP